MALHANDALPLANDDAQLAVDPAPSRLAPPRLPFVTKFLFGVGSMADGAQIQVLGGLLLLYYSQVLHVPTQLVSLAIGVTLFIDAFWDLLIAQISDNLRTPLGRRHALMYASALPAGLTFVALWSPPAHLAAGQLFAWLVTFVLLFRLSHSLYMVPSGALLPELAPDYHDRTVLFGYRYMLGTIGGAIAAGLAYGVFLRGTAQDPLGQLSPAGYRPMALTVGVFITVTNLISGIGTHSRIGHLYRPPKRQARIGEVLREIGSILNNHNFMVAVAAGMLSATSAALTQGLAIYFHTFMFHLPASNIMLLVGTQLLSAPIAFALAPLASRRWGKRSAYLALAFCSLVFVHAPIALRLIGAFPANGSRLLLPILMASNTVSGLLATSAAILGTSMIADIVEENQAKNGRRSEGVVLFCDRLLLKVATSLATILPGLLLALVHFPAVAHPATLAPVVLQRLALIYLPVSVGLSLASMATWLSFRIDHGAHRRNLELIAARRAAEADTRP